MPFKSEKQRRYLWKHHPEIAKEWSEKYGSKVRKKNTKRVIHASSKAKTRTPKQR